MSKQFIVTIGRQYGSGGHEIAEKIAEKMNVKIYDRNMLDEIANEKQVEASEMKQFDEKRRGWFGSRRVRGHSNSMQDHIAHMQFEYIEKKAGEGESFVVVGRCAEHVLKEHDRTVNIFILGDDDVKKKRLMELRNCTEHEAEQAMHRHDNSRKAYHNSHTLSKWGDSRTYDLCVNSSRLGIDGTVEFLIDYIQRRIDLMD